MIEQFFIRFERSGGFAGTGIDKTIDSLSLDNEEAEHLRAMIDRSEFFLIPAKEHMLSQPDRFTYKLTIELPGKKHEVIFSQASVPESIKDLVGYLIEKTRLRK